MKLELSVKGMTCGGCELHVEKAAESIEGVIKAKAYHSQGKLKINTDDSINSENKEEFIAFIGQAVSKAGYESEGLYSTGNFSWKQWVGILVILSALFLVVKETGIMNALPVIESSMSYGLIFIIGLMTSVHCIGMCGGINLTVSLSSVRKGNSEPGLLRRTIPALLYNSGRVLSYTLIGALVGALGSVISIGGATQGIIVGAAGIFMIIMGINMLGILPGLSRFLPRLPKGISSKIMGAGAGKGPFIVGLLNGFMPCGPLQSVQIYALGTGSALSGALSMFLFSLGTVPLMLGFGSLSTILPRRFHGRILKVSALLVLLLGGGMVLRGMSLNGVSLAAAGSFSSQADNVRIAMVKDGKQYVRTIMHGDEYEPFIVQAGIPVVWTIYAEESELNGCNNPLTVPEYGIRFKMEAGENIIEFTPPSEAGTITYTCWMGMITSGIKVVDDLGEIDESLLGDAAALSGPSDGGCSSGVGGGDGGCCGSSSGSTGSVESEISALFDNPLPPIVLSQPGIAVMADGIQQIEILVNSEGFEPSILVMKKNVPANLVFRGTDINDLNYRIYFPAYGYQGMELMEGSISLSLTPEGDFAWYSWKNDFAGFVKVVDDLETIDVEEISRDIEIFNAQN